MAKLGDLFVRLGLKKDEFSKGIKEAGNEVSGANGNGGLLGKLKGLATSSVAVFAAIAAAAYQMADKFAHTSQRLGDQWDQVTAGLKASWQTFIAAINSTDFSNLGQKIANAFRNAKNVAASTDAEFEVMNSIELQKSAMDAELESLRVQMRNMKLTQNERIKAAEQYLAKIKPIYEKEEKYRKEHAQKVIQAYLETAGVTYDQLNSNRLQDFLVNIAPNGELVAALDKFARSGFSYGALDKRQQKLLADVLSGQGGNEQGLQALAKIAAYYQSTADEQAKTVVDAIVKANYAAGAFDKETRRIQGVANQAVTMASSGAKKEDPAAAFAKRAESVMKDLQVKMPELKIKVDFDVEDIDMSEVDAEIGSFIDSIMADMQRSQDLVNEFSQTVVLGFSDAVQELTDQLTGLSDANTGAIFQALLTPLADMAVKAGEIIMAEGIATEAANSALETFGETGWAAVAAGAALIAAGAAAKSGLSALAGGGGRGVTSASTYQGSSGSAGSQTFETELTVNVKGTIRGSDIVLSGQRTVNSWGR